MEKLILQPTSTAQWHALINEAQASCQNQLGENLESYLVFLLMRFTDQPNMAHSILAMEFLEGAHITNPSEREQKLQSVGDKCLLFSGLFPERAERRRVTLGYFVQIGRSAYSTLSLQHKNQDDLYGELRDGFVPMMDVLQATRELGENHPSPLPLHLESIWRETGSQRAKSKLGDLAHQLSLINKAVH